jgi:serine/threonine-protein kinase
LLVERVAVGALATVYRATSANGDVAIKLYEGTVEPRFELESTAQRQAQHPAVARLLDAGLLADGTYFLASQWIDGAPLSALLAQPRSWDAIRRMIGAMTAGLGAIHAGGVVHRDLKPSNVMMPRAGSPAAVILDFSHALIVGDARLTATGVVLGSAAYMSPEQAAGAPLDGRSDLYALGVILYQLLTGVLPFDDADPIELLRRHQQDPIVSPRRRTPARDIPRIADDLCMWLLAKDRETRVPNAHVLSVTLGAVTSELGALGGVTLSEDRAS